MLAVLLAVWLAVSVIAQLGVVVPKLVAVRRFDPLNLIPQYNFFAPTPSTKDFHLMVRTGLSGDQLGRWHELAGPARQRWRTWIWNPEKRESKAMFDLAMTLARESQACSRTSIQISVSYLALLNYVTVSAGLQGASHLQFMIMISSGENPEEHASALFLSSAHRIS